MINILFLLKLPPPVTGATTMNQIVHDSSLLKTNFKIRSIRISYSNDIRNLGKYSYSKINTLIITFFKLITELLFHRPAFLYFQISPFGIAFYRDLIFIVIIKLFNMKILYHVHGKGIKKLSDSNYCLKVLYRFAFNKSYIISLSHLLVNDLEGLNYHKCYIVKDGIKPAALEIVKRHESGHPKLLFLSHLLIPKGILVFMESLNILKLKEYDFHATIIGAEGDLTAAELNALIAENKLTDRVSYKGPLYDHDKFNKLAHTDIFVFPTMNEAFGLVLLEAMNFGLPIVASSEGSIPDIIEDNVNGLLVEKGNAVDLADKIQILLEDEALRKYFGENNRKKFYANYTSDIFEKNMLNVFNDILRDIN